LRVFFCGAHAGPRGARAARGAGTGAASGRFLFMKITNPTEERTMKIANSACVLILILGGCGPDLSAFLGKWSAAGNGRTDYTTPVEQSSTTPFTYDLTIEAGKQSDAQVTYGKAAFCSLRADSVSAAQLRVRRGDRCTFSSEQTTIDLRVRQGQVTAETASPLRGAIDYDVETRKDGTTYYGTTSIEFSAERMSGGGGGGGGGGTPPLCSPKYGECDGAGDCSCGQSCFATAVCESCEKRCGFSCATDQDCVDKSKNLTVKLTRCVKTSPNYPIYACR
jgi:hypothetical protein